MYGQTLCSNVPHRSRNILCHAITVNYRFRIASNRRTTSVPLVILRAIARDVAGRQCPTRGEGLDMHNHMFLRKTKYTCHILAFEVASSSYRFESCGNHCGVLV
jgi:hypothetical protein